MSESKIRVRFACDSALSADQCRDALNLADFTCGSTGRSPLKYPGSVSPGPPSEKPVETFSESSSSYSFRLSRFTKMLLQV